MPPPRRTQHSESWWQANTDPAILRCTAHYKSGERCRSESLAGTSVCRKHGGAAPQVVAKAAVRIQMTADAAADYMRGVLNDPNVADRDKINAAKDILDRAGLGAAQKHLVGVAQLDPVEQLFQDILSTPGMLADPNAGQPKALPERDLAQEAVDAREEGGVWDLTWESEDVVDAEIVDAEPRPALGPAQVEAATRPAEPTGSMPRHIRDDLERDAELRGLL